MFLKPKELNLTEDEENEILERIYERSPWAQGETIKQDQYQKGENKKIQYCLFSWITGESEDKWISYTRMKYDLSQLGMTIQLYYDLVVLGINNTSKRPVCRYCGKHTKFKNFSRGYCDFCDLSCTAKWGNKVPSKIANVSKALTGKKLSKEHREALSRGAMKRLMNDNNLTGYHNVKKGYYSPKKSNGENIHYLSSWEETFMKFADNSDIIESIHSVDFKIPYTHKDIEKNYLPDFKLITTSKEVIIIEIKPSRQFYRLRNPDKFTAGYNFCKEKGYKYIILTENELFDPNFDLEDYIKRSEEIIEKIINDVKPFLNSNEFSKLSSKSSN